MIGVDRIFDVCTSLSREAADDPQILLDFREFLQAIFESASYQAWLSEDQYVGYRSVKGTPLLPVEACTRFPNSKHIMTRLGLARGGKLQVKIDKHLGRVHITDGFWVPPNMRVFPTSDESEIICQFIKKNLRRSGNDLLIDPACGCGHHALGLRDVFDHRVSLDISGRALAFAGFNGILGDDTQHLVGFADVRKGIPPEINVPDGAGVVFAVNMPFAMDPRARGVGRGETMLAQDGGDRGIELTFKAVDAVKEFWDRKKGKLVVDAVILCYTLGAPASVRGEWTWDIQKKCDDEFGAGHATFHLLEGERLWRVNGKKEQANPMPVTNLALKADCRFTYSDMVREEKRAGFEELAAQFARSGYTHLGYGIIHVHLDR